MSITHLTRSLVLALAATLLLAPSARAQHHHEFSPFIDPLTFNPDFQFFAPADLGDFGNYPEPNTGWFGAYNRMYVNVSRPQQEASNTLGDWTWGNRFDVGFMTDDGHGWLVSGMHIDGPNKFDVLIHPRVNRFNEDDDDSDNQGGGGGGGGGGGQQTNPPVFPVQDRNNPFTGARDIFIANSLNVADLSGVELNKVWRLDPLHSGGTLEPFMGVRYIKFRDETRRESYRRLDDDGVTNPLPNDTDENEEIILNHSNWDNDMIGGQLGLRWMERKSRWVLSSELRVFALENFQNFTNRIDTIQIAYDGVGDGTDVESEKFSRTASVAHNSEFVWGTDVRADAAFELTRDIALNMGFEYMGFTQGVARGNNPNRNEEEVHLFGLLFGLTLNR